MKKNFVELYLAENSKDKVSVGNWTDWRWQMRNTIRKTETVEAILGVTFSDDRREKLQETIDRFPLSVTPYYLSLVDPKDYENDPVFIQAFPSPKELIFSSADMRDPLSEERDSPAPGLTHRYPDRVLFHVSNVCAMYCRHCTRKRKVGDMDSIPSEEDLRLGLEYIRSNKEIRDVLLSGGDPFMLPDSRIKFLLDELSSIEHVEVIRIGTRIPVVLPFRITDELVDILSSYDNLWINTHFNHPKELTEAAKVAVSKLTRIGIPMGNQSVLLNGVNDCALIMKKLVQKLVRFRIRPYYLYQCDLSEGLEHFRTSVGKGIEIMESLRGHTSGFCIPTYVIDAPGGGGKIPVMPNYLISWSSNKVILRNYEGVITTYQEPARYEAPECDLKCSECSLQMKINKETYIHPIGIERLMSDYDDAITLNPMSGNENEN